MRIATWNVNSVKQRLPRLLAWLEERQPDVVCLQELKLTEEAFEQLLGLELAARGYSYAACGEPQWNGVAILSKVGLEEVRRGLPGAPGFPHAEARAISASCGGIRVHCVYVPNGREPGCEHYRYKLAWLSALSEVVAMGEGIATGEGMQTGDGVAGGAGATGGDGVAGGTGARVGDGVAGGAGTRDVVLCGDINIAPADADVFDPAAFEGHTHVTPQERRALRALMAEGLHDIVRQRWPHQRVFTYWDYRAGMFHKDLGMRIDLVLVSDRVAARTKAAWVDRQARKGKGPSDHAPVIVDLDQAPDGDIGPMVPPPSVAVGGSSRAAQC